MSTQHTPGAWTPFILDKPLAEVPDYVQKCILAGSGSEFFFVGAETLSGPVDVCHVGNGPCREANARLIAAAPELLEELRKTLALYDSAIRSEHEGTSMLSNLLADADSARAVIAKATGATA